ncbi:MAG: hypothetical protein EOO04_24735 [Chitinophagaceae bacterium]|nr:MAG: hypothetical protein EOO04_24735 [Chitinophagaceae bacterium]
MHSCDLLIGALNKYQGSIILVSHDRYFVSKTANKIWEIVDQQIKEFDGGYEEWVEWKERMKKAQQASAKSESKKKDDNDYRKPSQQDVVAKKEPAAPAPAAKPVAQPQAPINKDAKKELQRQQKIFQQLEEKLGELNKTRSKFEADLASPEVYADRTKFVAAESGYKKATQEIESLNKDYEKAFEKIMELETELGVNN